MAAPFLLLAVISAVVGFVDMDFNENIRHVGRVTFVVFGVLFVAMIAIVDEGPEEREQEPVKPVECKNCADLKLKLSYTQDRVIEVSARNIKTHLRKIQTITEWQGRHAILKLENKRIKRSNFALTKENKELSERLVNAIETAKKDQLDYNKIIENYKVENDRLRLASNDVNGVSLNKSF